jgi:hypothetical protein
MGMGSELREADRTRAKRRLVQSNTTKYAALGSAHDCAS